MRHETKYYEVTCKCGHVGRNNYVLIPFFVKAIGGSEAAEYARSIPRVKHDHKDAVRAVREISREEYLAGRKRNSMDPYLTCTSIQDQRKLDLSEYHEVFKEDRFLEDMEKHRYCLRARNEKAYMRLLDLNYVYDADYVA